VLNRDMLLDAMEHPEKYPSLTIRVSGYAGQLRAAHARQQMDW
jgi:formate C-acetyltransferase